MPLRRGRMMLLAIMVTAILSSAVSIMAMSFITSPAQRAAETAPPAMSVLTAAVERRAVRATVTMAGTALSRSTLDVRATSTADGNEPVVTALPLTPGTSLTGPAVVAEVSGRPIVVLQGFLPMYRDLHPGDTGADVERVQEALSAAGFSTGPADGVFGRSTSAAVASLYESFGYSTLPAVIDQEVTESTATAGVREAQRALEDARTALDLTTAADPGRHQAERAVTRAVEDLATARMELSAAQAKGGPLLPRAEFRFVPQWPAVVVSVDVVLGATPTGTLLTLGYGGAVVRGVVNAGDAQSIRAGQPVDLTGTTGTQSTGTVENIVAASSPGTEAQGNGAGSDNASPGAPGGQFDVVVVPADPIDVGVPVRASIRTAEGSGSAFVVPVSAVSQRSTGRETVTVVENDGSRTTIPVQTGVIGDGYVEIEPLDGATLADGTLVLVGDS